MQRVKAALPPEDAIQALEARAERSYTPCGSGDLVWRAWGAGPPLVLLHGAFGSWTHWVRNIGVLAGHYRVLAPDLPGFGDSADPPAPATVASLAETVAAGLDRLVPPPARPRIAGFSFGGIVGGLVAARPGARIHTLVLSGAGGMALPRAPIPPLARLKPGMGLAAQRAVHATNLHTLMLAEPAAVDGLAVHLQMENVRRARFRSGTVPSSDVLLRALPHVRARLAGLWGGRDTFAIPHVAERRRVLAAHQPGVDFRVIEGAGHWAIYEAADQANAALLELLADEG